MRVFPCAAAVAVVALLSVVSPAAWSQDAAPQTPDVNATLPVGHWAYRSLTVLKDRGLLAAGVEGRPSLTRVPVTRFEAAVAVARTFDRVLPPAGALTEGRAPSLYVHAQLRRLTEEFTPELTALGVDINTIRTRLDARLGPQPTETPRRFADVPQNHWAFDAVESARILGILRGYPDGTF